jgi:hypothetical protein
MRQSKLFIIVIALAILVVMLTSCARPNTTNELAPTPTSTPTPAPTTPTPVPTTPEPSPTPTPAPNPPIAPTPTPTPTPELEPQPTPVTSPEVTETEDVPDTTSDDEISVEGVAEIKEALPSIELITRNYVWEGGGSKWNWELAIPQELYDYYKAIPRPPTENYSVYITHPLDDTYIDVLIKKIKEAAQQKGLSEYETVEFAATFIQSLPYTADSVTTTYDEYPRYPVETLVDNGGDCEDTSILLASLIDKMGYGVALIMLPDHCAVGVKGGENIYGSYWEYKDDKYFYLETTNTGWGIGKLPEEYENMSATIYPLVPTPILTHEWSMEARGNTGELEVTVSNLGTAAAYNVSIMAGFDAGEGMLWNGKQSELFQVEANYQVTIKLILRVPLDKHTRLVVQIVIDDSLVDESHSVWVDT